MARRPRYHLLGGFYHVMIRGNDGQLVFFSDSDCCKMSLLIQEGVERFGHKVIAYCFMTNHVHLIIQVGQVPLSQIMQNLAFRYTRHVNRQRGRIGHLFQGRYRSIVVDGEGYLKELIRYVHLNPVRAGMAEFPELHRWSSHNVYLGHANLPWLSTDYILKSFGESPEEAIARYKNFIQAGLGMEEDIIYEKGMDEGVLGDEEFVTTIKSSHQRTKEPSSLTVSELMQAVCDHYGIDVATVIKQGKSRKAAHVRAVLALLVRELNYVTLEELAGVVGRDASGLSKNATRLKIKSMGCQEIHKELVEVYSQLGQMPGCQA